VKFRIVSWRDSKEHPEPDSGRFFQNRREAAANNSSPIQTSAHPDLQPILVIDFFPVHYKDVLRHDVRGGVRANFLRSLHMDFVRKFTQDLNGGEQERSV
jgi:hypothetical protein